MQDENFLFVAIPFSLLFCSPFLSFSIILLAYLAEHPPPETSKHLCPEQSSSNVSAPLLHSYYWPQHHFTFSPAHQLHDLFPSTHLLTSKHLERRETFIPSIWPTSFSSPSLSLFQTTQRSQLMSSFHVPPRHPKNHTQTLHDECLQMLQIRDN